MQIRGVNLPWLRYGGDFGVNVWAPTGGLSTRDLSPLHHALESAGRAGVEVVRWFVLCDGRAGILFDAAGVPVGLQPVVLDDLRTALAALRSHGLRMVPVLLDFTWADAPRLVNGVALGGRAWVLEDPVARYGLWGVIDELVGAFGHDPTIALWDVWNEPEWMAAPRRAPSRRSWSRALSRSLLQRCLAELVMHVRTHTAHAVTVGLASARGLPLCRDLALDVLQVHWYDPLERRCPLAVRPHVAWSEAPLVLGEFPTRGSSRSAVHIIETAHTAGYAGAWPWSLLADDDSSDGAAALHAIAHARDRT